MSIYSCSMYMYLQVELTVYNAQRMVESEINFWSYQMVTKNTLNANYYLSETSFK